jgi:hypothetical protein
MIRDRENFRTPVQPRAPLDAAPAVLQESIAAFVAECAKARLARRTPPAAAIAALAAAQRWERGLSPEAIGDFDIGPRAAAKGRRRHGEVWRALSAELTRRRILHSNDRVGQYGPDLFTYGATDVLFEIKAKATSHDIFEGVGQLHIYEQLLSAHANTRKYRKVLVVPVGVRRILAGPLTKLEVAVVSYERRNRSIAFDARALADVLR